MRPFRQRLQCRLCNADSEMWTLKCRPYAVHSAANRGGIITKRGPRGREEGSVGVGGRSRRAGRDGSGAGCCGRGRVSSSTEPIQTRNLSYQFLLGGVAKSSTVRLGVRYINATEFCWPRRGPRGTTARFHSSRGCTYSHPHPPSVPFPPPPITVRVRLPRNFVVFLFKCTPDYVDEYTSDSFCARFFLSSSSIFPVG